MPSLPVFVAHTALESIDWHRMGLFCSFNVAYCGLFLYAYQVLVFRQLFSGTIDEYTTLPWEQKLADGPGLKSMGQQVLLDLAVILLVYLPSFHIFREAMVGGGDDWLTVGLSSFACSFVTDAAEVLRVWGPADVLCFSLPLHQRLPVRHAISFAWTAYYSVTKMCGMS